MLTVLIHYVAPRMQLATALFFKRRGGQSLTEYALIILLVALVCVAAVALLGPTMIPIFHHANSGL